MKELTVKEHCGNILRLLQHNEELYHNKEYKHFGGYWELVLPLLRQYFPERLRAYEKECSENFTQQNLTVKGFLDEEDDLTNITNAIEYFRVRQSGNYAGEPHYITIGDEDIAYIPNESVDQDTHFGRENGE